ncbi:MAG: outer membrane beta-barrel protein [Cyclobacteriaceae bacterium]|nr:outer membrane beta-barrel protein [Cyclobacteriaceae bacterium]
MQKVVLALLFSATSLFIASDLKAQTGLGGGFSYGNRIERLGLDLRADFKLNDRWALSPKAHLFFPQSTGNITERWTSFNLDVHYLLNLENIMFLYPIAGINVTAWSRENRRLNSQINGSEIGINLGLGGLFKIAGNIDGFMEVKYTAIQRVEQAVVSFGILYRL